mgnify:CR=1 FL=1
MGIPKYWAQQFLVVAYDRFSVVILEIRNTRLFMCIINTGCFHIYISMTFRGGSKKISSESVNENSISFTFSSPNSEYQWWYTESKNTTLKDGKSSIFSGVKTDYIIDTFWLANRFHCCVSSCVICKSMALLKSSSSDIFSSEIAGRWELRMCYIKQYIFTRSGSWITIRGVQI